MENLRVGLKFNVIPVHGTQTGAAFGYVVKWHFENELHNNISVADS